MTSMAPGVRAACGSTTSDVVRLVVRRLHADSHERFHLK
jgi:hypothetical protein